MSIAGERTLELARKEPTFAPAMQTWLCGKRLRNFMRRAWPIVEPATAYVHGRHIDLICEHLEAVTAGEIKRLVINIPPRHTKSLLVSVFWFCWAWANNPGERFLYTTYSDMLAKRDSRKAREVILSPWFQERWPIKMKDDQNTQERFENTVNGFRMATTVLGKATGEGGDYVVTDDPHKADEVHYKTARDAVADWWDNTMSTRANDPKKVRRVIVMQRLHEGDLTGHVLKNDRDYEWLCLPAEFEPEHPGYRKTRIGKIDWRKEPGELLWPERFDRASLDELKRDLGTARNIAGQLQQRPQVEGGEIFKRENFRYYRTEKGDDGETIYVLNLGEAGERRVRAKDCVYFQTVDTAMKEDRQADYTVIETVASTPAPVCLIVVDVIRVRAEVPKQLNLLLSARAKFPNISVQCVEDKASGIGLIQKMRSMGIPVRPLPADKDKVRRAIAIAIAHENGIVFFPQNAPWLVDYEDELLMFPNGEHDDQVDAHAYAGIWNEVLSVYRSRGAASMVYGKSAEEQAAGGDSVRANESGQSEVKSLAEMLTGRKPQSTGRR